jgi:hypothetical protein
MVMLVALAQAKISLTLEDRFLGEEFRLLLNRERCTSKVADLFRAGHPEFPIPSIE